MVAIAPAFLIGTLALFFGLTFALYNGLAQVIKWRHGKSAANRPIIDASMDEKLGKISVVLALIITAVVFYFISKGPGILGITVLYGLIGLGLLVGIISFVISKPSIKPKVGAAQQKGTAGVQPSSARPNKESLSKVTQPDGNLIYFVGEPANEFLFFKCPVCDQLYAVSKTKYSFIFDCEQCKQTIQINRKRETFGAS